MSLLTSSKSDSQVLFWALCLAWGTVWILIIPISILAFLHAFITLFIRKSKRIFHLFLLSPFIILPIFNVCLAIKDYTVGKAKLKLIGYPSTEFGNINTEYRVYNHSLGCTFTGIEYLTSFRYNQVVKLLISNFGYQKGSYSGILPTKEEAILLVSSSASIGKISVDKKEFTIKMDSVNYSFNIENQHSLIKKTILSESDTYESKVKTVKKLLLVKPELCNRNLKYRINH